MKGAGTRSGGGRVRRRWLIRQEFRQLCYRTCSHARSRARQNYLRTCRMAIDDEVFVDRVGKHAGTQRHGRSGALGKIARGELAQQPLVFRIRLAPRLVRGRKSFAAMVIAAEFEAGNLEHRQSVVTAFIHGKVEDRETGRFEPLRPPRLQPRQHLPLWYCDLLERTANSPIHAPAASTRCCAR